MNSKKLKIVAYLFLVLSVFPLLIFTYLYISKEIQIEKELLKDYNYDYLQEIVEQAEEETSVIPPFNIDEMLAINDDFCGWIYIPETPVNYPVVQGTDNEYYLKRSFEKQYSAYGCVFMMTGVQHNADNIVLHGHNMGQKREEMFSSLLRYEEIDYLQKHPSVYFRHINEEEEAEYKIFAVVNFNFYNSEEFYYMIPEFTNDEEATSFINYLTKESMHETGVTASIEDQILILSTCYSIYGNDNRMLICATRVND